jgi:hypothetical protein
VRTRSRRPRGRVTGLLASVLAIAFCPACGAGPDRGHNLPEAGVARQAVEGALRAWQNSPQAERTTTAIRPVMFVEQQQPPGQQLRGFEVLGETPGYEDEGYRRVLVRLSLADPEESVVAAYYVFGRGPVWVYRAEDFEMIMHMDKSMMPPPPPPSAGGAGEPGPVRGEDATSASRAGSGASGS